MNKTELESKLFMVYNGDKNVFNELVGYYDGLKLGINELQEENKQLQKLINIILNWGIFKEECPINFGYEKESIEDKAQEVFYQNDDYCENNCNGDYKKCWLKYFKKMQELEGVNNE